MRFHCTNELEYMLIQHNEEKKTLKQKQTYHKLPVCIIHKH